MGEDVRSLLDRLGCSQSQAARIAGVRRQDIWNALHGHRYLSRLAMRRLSEAASAMRAENGISTPRVFTSGRVAIGRYRYRAQQTNRAAPPPESQE